MGFIVHMYHDISINDDIQCRGVPLQIRSMAIYMHNCECSLLYSEKVVFTRIYDMAEFNNSYKFLYVRFL